MEITNKMLDDLAVKKQAEFEQHFQDVMSGKWKPPKITEKDKHIYIVRCEQYHKIGIAENVRNRMDGMQTGSPFELVLDASLLVPRARELEQKLHKAFDAKRVRGEWFTLLDDADMLVLAKVILEHLQKDTK